MYFFTHAETWFLQKSEQSVEFLVADCTRIAKTGKASTVCLNQSTERLRVVYIQRTIRLLTWILAKIIMSIKHGLRSMKLYSWKGIMRERSIIIVQRSAIYNQMAVIREWGSLIWERGCISWQLCLGIGVFSLWTILRYYLKLTLEKVENKYIRK